MRLLHENTMSMLAWLMLNIHARLRGMEYSAAIGYVQTKYTKYTQTDDTPYGTIKVKDYPWASKLLRTVLPTSLNVSLVYTIGHTKTDTKP